MADKTYVVTAACAMIRVGGRFRTVQQGGAVPDGADPVHVKLLLDRGMITEGEPVGGVAFDPDTAPPFVVPEPEHHAGRRAPAKAAD